jgi:hypothetical protein
MWPASPPFLPGLLLLRARAGQSLREVHPVRRCPGSIPARLASMVLHPSTKRYPVNDPVWPTCADTPFTGQHNTAVPSAGLAGLR